MNSEMVWINEGFVLDDAGNLIGTTYIDLREEGSRTPISALVKGCKREHALEDGETILISKPARFREYGENLIRDEQEGLAKEESVTVIAETTAQVTRQRSITDLNEAREILNARVRGIYKETHSSRKKKSKSLAYGKEWWIFCTSIMPKDEECEAWKATLDEEYDHISKIGQPAKFAQALAHMVTEQIGPQGKDGWIKNTAEGAGGARTKHRTQWVIHGPVIYTDRPYDELTRDCDERTRLVASIFTKSTEYAAQREYRFAVLNEGTDAETVILQISGMMRDSLRRTEGGLVRPASPPAETAGDNQSKPSPQMNETRVPISKRTTVTERLKERKERRIETRTPDGQVVSSDIEEWEQARERTVTQDHKPADGDSQKKLHTDRDDDGIEEKPSAPEFVQNSREQDREHSDEEAVQELAQKERGWNGGRQRDNDGSGIIHSGAGRAYKSFEEMFNDPASPISPAGTTWQESACSPEEIVRTYGAVETLSMKVTQVRMENRQDAASACWHAMQCIRNIYARLGDIVESVWIERERFVVIRIKDSEELKATGRIVIAPSGAYAYCLQLPDKETSGYGGMEWGTKFFPMGDDVETFETFGWPGKAS